VNKYDFGKLYKPLKIKYIYKIDDLHKMFFNNYFTLARNLQYRMCAIMHSNNFN